MRIVGGAVAALLAMVGMVAVLPVHVSETTRGEARLLIGVAGGPPPATAAPQRSLVEAELISGSPFVVENLVDGSGVPVALQPPAGWSVVETGMSSGAAGSPLRVDASLRQLNFTVRSVDGGPSTVRMSVDGTQTAEIELVGIDPVAVQVESGVSVVTSTRRYRFSGVEVGLGPEVKAWLGPLPLDVVAGGDGSSVVPARSAIGAVALGLWRAANVVGVAVALLVAFLALGWALLGGPMDETDPTVAVAVGAAIPALLLGSLNYLLPVRVVVPLVAVVVGGFVWWRWRASAGRMGDGIDAFGSLVARASAMGPLLLTIAFIGLPAALTQHTNLGMLQTDIFDYLAVQQTYWDSSIVASGLDWGDGLRSIDSTVRSATVGWTHLTPMEGFTAVRFVAVAVALLTVGGACRALGARPAVVALVQLGVISVGSVTSLWVEGYLSREMFVWIAIPTLAVPMSVLGQPVASRARTWLALGAVFAWPAALVPPFMVTLLVPAIGLIAIARADGLAAARHRGLLFGGAFLGLWLPNGWWVLNIAKANEYANAVENIGKTFVVPFHADPEFPATALGLAGFHSNALSWQGPKVMDGFGWPVTTVLGFSNSVAASWSAGVLGLLALAAAGVAIVAKAEPTIRPRVLGLVATSLVVAAAVPVLVDVGWETQSFFVLMWVWTMSALLIIPILIGASVLRGRTGAVIAAPLLVLMLFNLGSSLLEMTLWFSHPQADGASYHHYDAAADMLGVQGLIDGGALPARDFVIERPASVTARDDDDRVLFNHLARQLQYEGASCLNCVRDARNGSVAAIAVTEVTAADRVLVIGANHCGDAEALYEGVLVALCGLGGPTAEPAGSTAVGRDRPS